MALGCRPGEVAAFLFLSEGQEVALMPKPDEPQLVNVEALEIAPTGVQVRILDGDLANRVGLIRRAELSWDQRPGIEPPWPQEGERLTARVLGGQEDRFVRLSLRLGDPWEDENIEERFQEGDVVQGHVVQLSRYGAFVQLRPGVDALARHTAIPLLPSQRLDEVLAVGDEVQAVITRMNPDKKRIEINLIERLRRLSLLSPEERRAFQMELFQDTSFAGESLPIAQDPLEEVERQTTKQTGNFLTALRRFFGRESQPQVSREEEQESSHAPLQPLFPTLTRLERILIVENDRADQRALVKRITEAFEVKVDVVSSGQEALEKDSSGTEYDLALIDVNLGDEDAVEIAEKLKQVQALLVIVYISRAPRADENLPPGSLFAPKDQGFESILQLITQLHQQEEPRASETSEEAPTSTLDFVRHLGMEAFARRSREDLLQPMLRRLRLQSRVSQAIVFEVDSINREVSVVAADPPLEEHARKYLLDRLYYSPVQNVVEDQETYYETNAIIRSRHPRFKRLYKVLPFRSCLGLPLTIPEVEVRHALFLFDEKRPRLELEDLDSARLAIRFLQVALERAAFFDFMQRYEKRYSRGLLINSLMHELATKLNTLDSLVETLPSALKKARKPTKSAERLAGLQEIQEIMEDLQAYKQEMGDLVDAYLQTAREEWQDVDVNQVVEKVRLQMIKMAEESQIAIHVEAGETPPARAIASHLEQVLLNLILNAIQQIDHQRKVMARLPRRADDLVLLQKGQIIVRTRFVESDPVCPIQILVIDTGPGVRYPERKRIFRLDTTSRKEGHGWGLFLSRNLVEFMHGRLRLAGSVRFVGSAFAVELPSFPSRGAQ